MKPTKIMLFLKKRIPVLLAALLLLCFTAACAEPYLHIGYTCSVPDGADAEMADLLAQTVSVIRERLAGYGYADFDVAVVDGPGITVDIRDPEIITGNESALQEILDLIGRKGNMDFVAPDGSVFMTGDMIESARYVYNYASHQVEMRLTPEGTQIFAEATEKYIGMNISVILDDECLLDARVQEPVRDGVVMISGQYTQQEATLLAAKLQGGTLPLDLTLDFMDVMEPADAEPEEISGTAETGDAGWTCPVCGRENDSPFCPMCGTEKPEEPAVVICPQCGREYDPDAGFLFCMWCGADLRPAAPTIEGTWKQKNIEIEFDVLYTFSDGVLTVSSPGYTLETKYEVDGGKLTILPPEGQEGETAVLDFTVDEHTLTLIVDGETLVFER